MKTNLEWGISTWHLLHYIGENIDSDFYNKEKYNIVNMVKTICYNLPCPDCAEHAKYYLKNINVNTLDTLEKYRILFFNFHNLVNKNIDKEPFDFTNLKKYKTYKLDAILNNFSIFYGKRYNVGLQLSLESNEMHRKNIVKKVLTWFKNNFCK